MKMGTGVIPVPRGDASLTEGTGERGRERGGKASMAYDQQVVIAAMFSVAASLFDCGICQ